MWGISQSVAQSCPPPRLSAREPLNLPPTTLSLLHSPHPGGISLPQRRQTSLTSFLPAWVLSLSLRPPFKPSLDKAAASPAHGTHVSSQHLGTFCVPSALSTQGPPLTTWKFHKSGVSWICLQLYLRCLQQSPAYSRCWVNVSKSLSPELRIVNLCSAWKVYLPWQLPSDLVLFL